MKNKAKKPPDLDKDESPFARYLPDNPILAGAWLSCLQCSLKQPGVLEAFREATGNNVTPAQTPLDRMIDQATGHERAFVEQFAAWFNKNVWGEI
jgi:hypothetical protein